MTMALLSSSSRRMRRRSSRPRKLAWMRVDAHLLIRTSSALRRPISPRSARCTTITWKSWKRSTRALFSLATYSTGCTSPMRPRSSEASGLSSSPAADMSIAGWPLLGGLTSSALCHSPLCRTTSGEPRLSLPRALTSPASSVTKARRERLVCTGRAIRPAWNTLAAMRMPGSAQWSSEISFTMPGSQSPRHANTMAPSVRPDDSSGRRGRRSATSGTTSRCASRSSHAISAMPSEAGATYVARRNTAGGAPSSPGLLPAPTSFQLLSTATWQPG